MKYPKSAAVVAGSLLALGSWSPTFAAGSTSDFAAGADGPNFSLDDGLSEATRKHDIMGEALSHPPIGVSGPQVDDLKNAVLGITKRE
jgi:hypothetical protein